MSDSLSASLNASVVSAITTASSINNSTSSVVGDDSVGEQLRLEIERRSAVEMLLAEITKVIESQKQELSELRSTNSDLNRQLDELRDELKAAKHQNAVLDVAIKEYIDEKLAMAEVWCQFFKKFSVPAPMSPCRN